MFGGGLAWFYRNLAGMQADPDQPGYRHIIFRPQPVDDMEFVSYFNQTSYGRAGIQWKNEADAFVMEVEVLLGRPALIPGPYPGAINAGVLAERLP